MHGVAMNSTTSATPRQTMPYLCTLAADLLVNKVFAELPLMTEPKGVVVDVLREGSKMKQKEWKEWNGLARWMEVEST